MAVQLSPEIKKRFLDSAGDPLSGGKLYVYEAGTTTPTATYIDSTGLTSNTNPIVLDSVGEADIWLNPNSYKFVLKDSLDTEQWTVDNILIRDLGAEIDALDLGVTDLNETVSETLPVNRLVSGKKSANSSQSLFLIPSGSANEVTVSGSTTSLAYYINSIAQTLSADIVGSGLVSAPTSNNTCIINDATLSDQEYTKMLGENGNYITYDNTGSEVAALDGKLGAFKVVNGSAETEYFVGQVDNVNTRIKNTRRGYFFNSSSAPIQRIVISDNDVITVMKLARVYLTVSQTLIYSYTEPVYSASEPTSPLDGDMWYDTINKKWFRFNSSSYVETSSIFVGICIQDENGNTVGARSRYFYQNRQSENTFELEILSASSISTKTSNNSVSVYGKTLMFNESFQKWNLPSDLADGLSEENETVYYLYKKENGENVIDVIAPYDCLGELGGDYHPYETWRFLGMGYNDASGDLNVSWSESGIQNEYEAISCGAFSFSNVSFGAVATNQSVPILTRGKKRMKIDFLSDGDPGGGESYFDCVSINIYHEIRDVESIVLGRGIVNGDSGGGSRHLPYISTEPKLNIGYNLIRLYTRVNTGTAEINYYKLKARELG